MDKTKIKIDSVTVGYAYNDVSAIVNGVPTSFCFSKDVDVAQFEGKYAYISTDASGAFKLEAAKAGKE